MNTARPVAFVLLLALAAQPSAASGAGSGDDVRKVIEDYCSAISDLAAERRVARQTAALKDLEKRVEERLQLLDSRTRELADLIRKRDDLRNLADKELVDIYAGVDAEAAAEQMGRLDLRLASSVLRQLKPRQASAILDVMKPDLAAALVRLIAVSAPKDGGRQ